MRPSVVACFLVFGALACAGTREAETDAVFEAPQSRAQPERTMPENIRVLRDGRLPSCPYRVIGEVEAHRGRNELDELRARAFAQKADAIILLADDRTSPLMGLAIVFRDPDCRY